MRKKTMTRRKSATPRRRKTHAVAHHTKKHHTRRRTTRRRSLASDFFNPTQAKEAGMTVVEGIAGGVGAHFLGKMLPASLSAQYRGLITIGAGFVTSAMFRRPILGAGMAAVGAINLMKEINFLQEDYALAEWSSGMESLPMVLNESGMYALSDAYALSEEADAMYTDSPGMDYEVGYAPEFGGI